jgi:uncharacterized protein YraI
MHLSKFILASVGIAATMALAGPASAATATSNVNVRSSPGGSVVDVLRSGERADIVRRSGSWCEIERRRGRDGWVSCQYLSGGNGGGGSGSGGSVSIGVGNSGQPNINFNIPGFNFSIGEGGFDRPDRPNRPNRPGRDRDEVCFYEDVNFGGDSFCARPGERIRSLGQWNDRISSIRVRGDAQALVCEHDGFDGRCVTVNRNARDLGRNGNDIISSIRVR